MDTRVKSTYMCAYTINYECTDWDAQWMASYHSYVETHLYLAASLIRAFADDGGAVVLFEGQKALCIGDQLDSSPPTHDARKMCICHIITKT